MAPVLLGASVLLSLLFLPLSFLGVLIGYVAVSLLYSFWIKRFAIIDIVALSGMYTARVFAGAAFLFFCYLLGLNIMR